MGEGDADGLDQDEAELLEMVPVAAQHPDQVWGRLPGDGLEGVEPGSRKRRDERGVEVQRRCLDAGQHGARGGVRLEQTGKSLDQSSSVGDGSCGFGDDFAPEAAPEARAEIRGDEVADGRRASWPALETGDLLDGIEPDTGRVLSLADHDDVVRAAGEAGLQEGDMALARNVGAHTKRNEHGRPHRGSNGSNLLSQRRSCASSAVSRAAIVR